MHIFFSGIGGTGIGPLALICQQAGYEVSGSDMQHSQYTDYLVKKGVNLHIGQTKKQIEEVHRHKPIDWIVFSSAVFIHNPSHPELEFAQENSIKFSKRDECLNSVLTENNLKLVAIAGTHGKTTTTAMMVWIFKQLGLPVSYSVGAKLPFGPMGDYDPKSEFFIYECDEFDRNFLSFNPYVSIITAIDWDHHEFYPTRQDYKDAFREFTNKSGVSFIYNKDANYLAIEQSKNINISDTNSENLTKIKLAGIHNRQNAWLCVQASLKLSEIPQDTIINAVNLYPGVSRRFEKLAPNIYTDYAHTPEEVAAILQLAKEVSEDVVVAYEPLTDRRQHYMKEQYRDTFIGVKKLYWLPSYLAREDPNSPILSPNELINYLSNLQIAEPAEKNHQLKDKLLEHARQGHLVLCIAGGGGGSLDEWARDNLA